MDSNKMGCQAVIVFSVVLAIRASGLVFRDGAYDGAVVRVGEEAPVADCTRILRDLEVRSCAADMHREQHANQTKHEPVKRGRRNLHSNFACQSDLACDP
jgi:hypothetical protein